MAGALPHLPTRTLSLHALPMLSPCCAVLHLLQVKDYVERHVKLRYQVNKT